MVIQHTEFSLARVTLAWLALRLKFPSALKENTNNQGIVLNSGLLCNLLSLSVWFLSALFSQHPYTQTKISHALSQKQSAFVQHE